MTGRIIMEFYSFGESLRSQAKNMITFLTTISPRVISGTTQQLQDWLYKKTEAILWLRFTYRIFIMSFALIQLPQYIRLFTYASICVFLASPYPTDFFSTLVLVLHQEEQWSPKYKCTCKKWSHTFSPKTESPRDDTSSHPSFVLAPHPPPTCLSVTCAASE